MVGFFGGYMAPGGIKREYLSGVLFILLFFLSLSSLFSPFSLEMMWCGFLIDSGDVWLIPPVHITTIFFLERPASSAF